MKNGMKKIYYLIAILVAVNLGLLGVSCTKLFEKKMNQAMDTENQLYQETVFGNGGAPNCFRGGKNHSTCKIEDGFDLNGRGDLTTECSVTCEEGYWACCSYACHCEPVSKWDVAEK